MLKSLLIENAAVIQRLELIPDAGFTVLTGETGSGKSVIVDCLSFLLGNRAERDLVRSGEDKALVCAVFGDFSPEETENLSQLGFSPEEGELIAERTLSRDGKTVNRVNGRPVTLRQLNELGKLLVSLHSQDDTATLESRKARTDLLDAAACDADLLSAYKETYRRWSSARRRLAELQKDSTDREQLRDILTYQIREIRAAKLTAGEEELLEDEKRRIQGAEKLRKYTGTALKALQYNEKGITAPYLCDRAADALEKLSGVYPECGPLAERLRSCRYEMEDVASEIASLTEESCAEEDAGERIDTINDRLELISRLKRKYGPDTQTILSFCDTAAQRLSQIENSDEAEAELRREIDREYIVLTSRAEALSDARRQTGRDTEAGVRTVLEYLDMPKVRFCVSIRPSEAPGPDGWDDVDFLLAANPGEPMLPLEKCASGGELSRVMLALRCSFAGSGRTGTLVFDEIDTGISGKTSRKVGHKLREVSGSAQVLCVTHSAQIASLAERHLKIVKEEKDGRASSSVRDLSREGRIDEVARILGGISVSEAQRQAAVDMIDHINE